MDPQWAGSTLTKTAVALDAAGNSHARSHGATFPFTARALPSALSLKLAE
jgi:hypothetical protein